MHIDDDQQAFHGGLDAALGAVGAELTGRGLDPAAVSHRVVHGGPRHDEPTIVDDDLLRDLQEAVPLAPLHLPGAIDSMTLARRRWPDVPHVACFDTTFHRTLPEAARRLPVPPELVDLGVRRYGFHGLSVQSVLARHPGLGDVVVAHLGSGCSVTAVDTQGRSRHTTMSMTPTAGMMSSTRTGDLDPEIVLFLIEEHGYPPAAVRQIVDRASGLAGVAVGRRDVRELLAAADDDAALALQMFVRSAAMAIAACATALDCWDNLVFTGGVGERSEVVRDRIVHRLHLPPTVRVQVVPADEELVLDREARVLLAGR